jgi:hypothetical protein
VKRLASAQGFAGLALLVVGCSIPLADTASLVTNRCESSSDCPGAVCYSLATGSTCVATQGGLTGVILEVRPTPGAGYGAGVSHLFRLEELGVLLAGSAPGGYVVPADLRLPALVEIGSGKVTVGEDFKPAPCLASDGSIPVRLELRPVTHYVGLTLPSIEATTAAYAADGGPYAFDLAVPPGTYDVYVEPLRFDTLEEQENAGCTPPPPLFLGGQTITHDVDVALEMPAPSHLTGRLVVPKGIDVQGWTLDLVEPSSGRLVSTQHVFEAPKPSQPPDDPLSFSAAFDVHYHWVDPLASPIVRLRPPDGLIAPRVYWDFASAAIFGDKDVPLTLSDLELTPKHIQATVLDEDKQPVVATVTIQSKGLSGGASANASYTVTAETGPDGQFEADLLLGNYRVLARPKVDPSKALAIAEWTVKKDDLCCGRVISVSQKAQLRGRVTGPTGAPLPDAAVVAEPPLPRPTSFLDQVLGLAPVLPDKATTFPDSNGSFALGVDPDPSAADVSVDFFVRPPLGAGYPWLVRPRVKVETGGTDLGGLTVPYPTVLTGRILDPSGNAVGPAVVRAFLTLPDDDTNGPLTGSVIPIAESEADPAGVYVLALPPSVAE